MIAATVSGNLGKPAELRDTRAGSVLSFSVASNEKVKGEKRTTWVRCSLWGKRAEALAQYLTKGTRVVVTGTLSTHEHDGKTYLEIRASDVELMGGGERGGSSSSSGQGGGGYDEQDYGDKAGDDDDLPF